MEEAKQYCSEENLRSLCNRFYEVFDAHKYAEGWNYKCAFCHRTVKSVQAWFPCHQKFLTTKIKCLVCGNSWRLKINCEVPSVETLQ